jgi:hypothetical protein
MQTSSTSWHVARVLQTCARSGCAFGLKPPRQAPQVRREPPGWGRRDTPRDSRPPEGRWRAAEVTLHVPVRIARLSSCRALHAIDPSRLSVSWIFGYRYAWAGENDKSLKTSLGVVDDRQIGIRAIEVSQTDRRASWRKSAPRHRVNTSCRDCTANPHHGVELAPRPLRLARAGPGLHWRSRSS